MVRCKRCGGYHWNDEPHYAPKTDDEYPLMEEDVPRRRITVEPKLGESRMDRKRRGNREYMRLRRERELPINQERA